MALIPCTSCNHHISDKALTCPKCGISINSYTNKLEINHGFSEVPQELSESELNYTDTIKSAKIQPWLILFPFVGVVLIGVIALSDFRDAPTVYFERGLAEKKAGNNRRAIDNYNAAIRLKPDYTNAYIYRGMAKSDLGDAKEAKADFDEARRLQQKTDSASSTTPVADPISPPTTNSVTGDPTKDVKVESNGCMTIPLSYVPVGRQPQEYKEDLKRQTGAKCIFWDVNR